MRTVGRSAAAYRAAFIVIGALLVLGANTNRAEAQSGCTLQLNQSTLELGEMVPLELNCINTPPPSAPQASVPAGLDLKLVNAHPAQFSQTSIINGRVSRESRYTFSMQLTGLREGTYTLGPITIEAESQTFHTEPVSITVKKTEVQTGTNGDRRIFLEMSVEPTSLYATQEYVASLTIGIRKVQIGGRTYEVDLLRQVLDLGASQLSVFAGGQARQSERTLTDSGGDRHRYVVYQVDQRLRADSVGDTLVGPVFIKARYPTALRETIFGRMEFSRVENETARADGVTVSVKGAPLVGRPKSFNGAIGRYALTADVRPTHIEQGEPVTLTLTIRGEPLDGLAGPNLSAQPELTSRFDFAQDELVGDVEGNAKIFRRAVFPRQPGDQTVPSIEWSYFDPSTEQYVTLRTDPVPISIDRRTAGSESTVTLLPTGAPESRTPALTVISDGLAANYVDPDFVLVSQSALLTTPVTVGALALPPLFCLVVTLTARHRSRLRNDSGYTRRRKARTRAESIISRAMRNGAATDQWTLLGQAMTSYLSDRFDLPSGTLTPTDARQTVLSHVSDESLADEVAAFLTTCDAAQYAPGMIADASVADTAQRVLSWINRIEGKS